MYSATRRTSGQYWFVLTKRVLKLVLETFIIWMSWCIHLKWPQGVL